MRRATTCFPSHNAPEVQNGRLVESLHPRARFNLSQRPANLVELLKVCVYMFLFNVHFGEVHHRIRGTPKIVILRGLKHFQEILDLVTQESEEQ